MEMDPTPRCSKCDNRKPLSEFPPSKAKNRGQWCRMCLRDDARRRLGLTATNRSVLCVQCGATFATSYTKALYCSRSCKDRAHKNVAIAERLASKPHRRCVWCGVEMPQSMRADAYFCSTNCNSKAHQASRKARSRGGKGTRTRPLLSFIDIAERDHWRCGICGKSVNRRLAHPDPLAGSLDHILPLSVGGDDEDPSNVQLAHFQCNWSKGARAVNDQLRLIG